MTRTTANIVHCTMYIWASGFKDPQKPTVCTLYTVQCTVPRHTRKDDWQNWADVNVFAFLRLRASDAKAFW